MFRSRRPSEPLKPPERFLAFDMVVGRAIGGTETVDTVRKSSTGRLPRGLRTPRWR